jgi:tetratricopeptide (TPR) repeat protein
MLTYMFSDISNNSAVLSLNWEKKQFPVKIEFAVADIVLENAATELQGDKGFSWQAHASAANYAIQNNSHLEQALAWSDRAIGQNRNFTTLNTKARVLEKMGKKSLADSISAEAFKLATEAELNAYGYQLLNQGNHDKAIEIFTLNTKKFPKSANCYDSLGEAYATKGDKEQAIANFKKALAMNPEPNVKANSEKFLKQLSSK